MFSGYGIQAISNDWSAFERLQVDVGNETDVLAALASKLGSNRVSVRGVLFVEQVLKASISSIMLGRRFRILIVNIAELTKPDYWARIRSNHQNNAKDQKRHWGIIQRCSSTVLHHYQLGS
jgi:hypothetical protein